MRSIVPRIAFTLAGLGAVMAAPVEGSEWPLRVVTVAGGAETQPAGASAWMPAALRVELGPAASARTLQGRLALRSAGGQQLRLAPLSRISFLEGGPADQPTRVRVDAGSVWAAVVPDSPTRMQLEVQTAPVTIVVVGGGVEITLDREGSALVRVYHGAAACSGRGTERWNRVLGDKQELLVPSDGRPGRTRTLDRDKLDLDWVKWNEDQDLAGGYGGTPAEK
jgi:FecR-like protein